MEHRHKGASTDFWRAGEHGGLEFPIAGTHLLFGVTTENARIKFQCLCPSMRPAGDSKTRPEQPALRSVLADLAGLLVAQDQFHASVGHAFFFDQHMIGIEVAQVGDVGDAFATAPFSELHRLP
jgi:hypothetical protein